MTHDEERRWQARELERLDAALTDERRERIEDMNAFRREVHDEVRGLRLALLTFAFTFAALAVSGLITALIALGKI